MERRTVPNSQPSWMYLTNRQLVAGDHIRTTGRHSLMPKTASRPRKATLRYSLMAPKALAPWASTTPDSSLGTLLGHDD